MRLRFLLALAAAFAFASAAADTAPTAGTVEPDYPVVKYAVCTAMAQVGGVVMASRDPDRARTYFNEAVTCLEQKFPTAVAESEGHPDLIAALKEHYVQAMAWAKSMGSPLHRQAFDAAFQRVKMEATIAKKWKPKPAT